MKKKQNAILPAMVLAMALMSSCSPRVATSLTKQLPPLDASREVRVYMPEERLPPGGKLIGTIKVGDSGFSTHCNFEKVMLDATNQTRLSGGNALKVTHHKGPDAWSTCHRIEGKMYLFDPDDLSVDESVPDHATLKVFRYPDGSDMKTIKLTANGEIFAFVPEEYKAAFRVDSLGMHYIQTDPPMNQSVAVNFEAGKEYYLKCSAIKVPAGVSPNVTLMDEKEGLYAYNSLLAKYTGPGERFAPAFSPLKISFSGGYGYRTGKVGDASLAYEDFLKKLKHGYNLSADVCYYFDLIYGVGFRYQHVLTSHSQNDIRLSLPGVGFVEGDLKEDIRMRFIGPYFSLRAANARSKHAFFSNLGFGYVDFLDVGYFYDQISMEGSTAGVMLEFGYDYFLTDHVAIGIQAGYFGATLFDITISDGVSTENIELEEGEYISAGHLDLSAGIRFYF